jgi:cytochrome b561
MMDARWNGIRTSRQESYASKRVDYVGAMRAFRAREIHANLFLGVRTMRAVGNSKRGTFDRATRLLHWLTAGLMLSVFVLVFSIDLATSRAAHTVLLQLHRSVGLTVWVVTLGRLAWRHFAKYPDWPSDMSRAMRLAATASEYALYALLLAQPILGILQTNARGDQVNLFFIGSLPMLIEKNRPLAQQLLTMHKTAGFSLLGLIALHVSAALFHHFWRRDDTLTAMLPAAAAWRTLEPRADQACEAAMNGNRPLPMD